jgi:probable F420-dependent oxidoreductase
MGAMPIGHDPGVRLTGTGIWSRELRQHEDPEAVAAAAVLLEELGYTALWIPGGIGGPVLERAEHLLGSTREVPVATGILNIWMHDPLDVAATTHYLDNEFPGRFLLGLGVSHGETVNAQKPGTYGRPLTAMREYLDALDAAEPPVPKDARVLAALGPKMLELARDRSAGAHPYLTTPEHTRFARGILGEGPLLAPEQGVIVEPNMGRAHEIARAHFERYLGMTNYVNNLRRLGFDDFDFENGGSDRLLHDVFAMGEPIAARTRVREHMDAGADHVCIQVITDDPSRMPLAEWRALAEVLV